MQYKERKKHFDKEVLQLHVCHKVENHLSDTHIIYLN